MIGETITRTDAAWQEALRDVRCASAVGCLEYVQRCRYLVVGGLNQSVIGASWEMPYPFEWQPGIQVVDVTTGQVWEGNGGDAATGARDWVPANFSPLSRPKVRKPQRAQGAQSFPRGEAKQ